MKMKFGIVSSHTVEYPKIGGNNTAVEICEVGPIGGALWWPKSELCPKLKQRLKVQNGYHNNQGKQYYNLRFKVFTAMTMLIMFFCNTFDHVRLG
jgi:hypothetical protein